MAVALAPNKSSNTATSKTLALQSYLNISLSITHTRWRIHAHTLTHGDFVKLNKLRVQIIHENGFHCFENVRNGINRLAAFKQRSHTPWIVFGAFQSECSAFDSFLFVAFVFCLFVAINNFWCHPPTKSRVQLLFPMVLLFWNFLLHHFHSFRTKDNLLITVHNDVEYICSN